MKKLALSKLSSTFSKSQCKKIEEQDVIVLDSDDEDMEPAKPVQILPVSSHSSRKRKAEGEPEAAKPSSAKKQKTILSSKKPSQLMWIDETSPSSEVLLDVHASSFLSSFVFRFPV